VEGGRYLVLIAVQGRLASLYSPTYRGLAFVMGGKHMIRHSVFFWLKDVASGEDRERVAKGLAALAEIEVVRDIKVGVPADTVGRDVVDSSFSVSSMVLFDSEADEAIYQNHPLHLRFIAECGLLWEKVVVYDSRDLA
jgi:hypothetical protein